MRTYKVYLSISSMVEVEAEDPSRAADLARELPLETQLAGVTRGDVEVDSTDPEA